MTKKFKIITFGCKVNQADSEEITSHFLREGYQLADGVADVCVVNTCTVTKNADFQCRQMIRRLRGENPSARIIATGCYANIAGDELKKMPEVDEVVVQLCGRPPASPREAQLAWRAGLDVTTSASRDAQTPTNRTRPQLKVQDGCNNYCTYCIVPYARGPSRSIPPDQVLKRLEQFKNYYEIVLTGIHLGGYGADLLPKTTLLELLKLITAYKLQVTSHELRFRLSSIDPDEWTSELIEFVAANNFICPHFHIPLQSGDDEILIKMGRRYTTKKYRHLILELKSKIAHASVGADVIVGFPGETKESFERTKDFIESLPLTYLHVFPYSQRPRTAASKFLDAISLKEKSIRARSLRQIGLKKKEQFYRQHIGKLVDVVVEGKRDRITGKLKGISANYMPVLFDGIDALMGRLERVSVLDVSGGSVFGKVMGGERARIYSARERGVWGETAKFDEPVVPPILERIYGNYKG